MQQHQVKLRTVNDVLNRLRWSDDNACNPENTLIGYKCRINGPMETPTDSYTAIDKGGDIPQHRIQYIRKKIEGEETANPQAIKTRDIQESLLWDRRSKLDRLFGSGGGKDAAVAPTTVDDVRQARATDQRITEERRLWAEEKAKRRARIQQRKVAATTCCAAEAEVGTNPNNNNNNNSPYVKRHTWSLLEKWLEHDGSKWTLKVHVPHGGSINNNQPKKLLRIVTWNVLFDLQRDSNGSFEQGDNLIFDDKKLDTTTTRQNAIVDMLKAQNYAEGLDIICLQECTHSFITILQKQKWVQKEFAIRTSAILAPYGNMIIWNKHVFSVEEKYICQDAVRNRVLICSLKTRDGTIVNVANVHLPADKNDKDANAIEKTQARQQELSSIIGKLQLLEGLARTAPIPIIAGDFNGVSHGALISKALPETVWVDSWKTVSSDPGLAVDWSCNKRANISAEAGKSQKMLRKIDSVWYGKIKGVNAIATELIDDVSNDSGLHPSDHFGVAVTFALASCSSHTTRVLSDVNAWGKAVLPSSRSLLALILDKGYIQTKLFDKKSTLPMPHITVLNNFVDLTSMDAVKLAHQTIQTAIMESLNPNINQKFSIDLASFDVFEHNLSATAVCKPTDEWLFDLYKALMHHFPSSHEQESRLATEWTPHMSLGTFENAGNARLFLETLEVESPRQVHAIGIGMFQRSNDDGNLHVIAVIPLQPSMDAVKSKMREFWHDVGTSQCIAMKSQSIPLVSEIESAFEFVVSNVGQQSGMELTSCIKTFGSAALEASHPCISDLNLIAIVQSTRQEHDAKLSDTSQTKFLKLLCNKFVRIHEGAKIRIRISSNNGIALHVLTIHLPGFPSADILLCRVDSKRQCLDAPSLRAMDSLTENIKLLQAVSLVCGVGHNSNQLHEKDIFAGALRVIKLWAHRRQIYGSNTGYLGGGGWAVLLVWMWQKEILPLHTLLKQCKTSAEAALILAKYFFVRAGTLMGKHTTVSVERVSDEAGVARSNLCVIGPMGANHGASSTPATALATKSELTKAFDMLQKMSKEWWRDPIPDALMDPIDLVEAFEQYVVLCVTLNASAIGDDSVKPAEVKAWGAAKALRFGLRLSIHARPFSRPAISKTASKVTFYFTWGIEDGFDLNEIRYVSDRHSMHLKEEAKLTFAGSEVSVRIQQFPAHDLCKETGQSKW